MEKFIQLMKSLRASSRFGDLNKADKLYTTEYWMHVKNFGDIHTINI